jgi:hypothetical protein
MSNQDGYPFTERRKYIRLRKRFVVRVVSVAGEESIPGPAVSEPSSGSGPVGEEISGKDIALGGLAIESQHEYRPGTRLVLEVLLPELGEYLFSPSTGSPAERSGLFRVECEVIWSGRAPDGKLTTGLRFVNLSERQFKAISQLIAHQLGV